MFKYSTIIEKRRMCVHMQVQAVNNQAFGQVASKEVGSNRRANIDAAIAIKDNDLRRFAYYQACLQTDEEKHNNTKSAGGSHRIDRQLLFFPHSPTLYACGKYQNGHGRVGFARAGMPVGKERQCFDQ